MKDPLLPLQQSPEFARCLTAMGQVVTRHRIEGQDITWQVQSKGIGGMGLVDLVTRGPVGDMGLWFQHWREFQGTAPLILNAPPCPAEVFQSHGFWPLITPVSLAVLDLRESDDMRQAMGQKWRNRLRAAENTKIKISHYGIYENHWLIAAENAQARQKKYKGYPAAFSTIYGQLNPGLARVFEAQHRGDIIAGIVVFLHAKTATWQIGHSLQPGRQMNAMNLLLWRAMCWLSERGYQHFDLGILNGEDAEGLTRFKLGSGAKAERQGGTWIYTRQLAPFAKRLPLFMAGVKKEMNVQCAIQAGKFKDFKL